MSGCIFCAILAGQAAGSFLYRDDLCSAIMDIHQPTTGKLLVIPNQHATYLADLSPETGARMFQVAQQLAAALRRTGIRCEGVNLFLSDGSAAGAGCLPHAPARAATFRGRLRFGHGTDIYRERAELDRIAEQIKQVL